MPRTHPRDADIRALLATHSTDCIAAQLGVDRAAVRRIRRDAGIDWARPEPDTAASKWAARVRPVDGGHLEWLGERGSTSGSPVMRLGGKSISPAAIAFRRRTGRDPVGPVRAECGYPHCVSPDHVDDTPGRQRLRAQLRALHGRSRRRTRCGRGHDQQEHGRFGPDGAPYCGACSVANKHTPT
ncbi:hypothetical protein [Streptodolium elevatio]|uniref:Uncharacterized protein n=1 Tax=Streptodolium elevatio TaxID=3157996 RepID=A0ABV3DV45_9ACTN